jgi:hypothetical protein
MEAISEIRRGETGAVADLYLDACRRLNEAAPGWGMPDREPIHRWIDRTIDTDDAVCLVRRHDEAIVGCLLASVSRHPAMPGTLGELEELMVTPGPDHDRWKRELVDAGVAWARERGASPIRTTIGLDSPWRDDELAFWTGLGFEHDVTLVTRYFPQDEGC